MSKVIKFPVKSDTVSGPAIFDLKAPIEVDCRLVNDVIHGVAPVTVLDDDIVVMALIMFMNHINSRRLPTN